MTQNAKEYTASFLNLFDTVTTIVGRAESKDAFEKKVQTIHAELEVYHKLFDIYNEYDGINNIKTVNDKAVVSPIKVDRAIIDLLFDCKEYYKNTNGKFNPAMGSVISLWHNSRIDSVNDPEDAYIPDLDTLTKAGKHIDPDNIILDIDNSTVFFADPDLKIDVGAIAKGWAVQRVCENAPEGLLISVGGNVCATGAKDRYETPWVVGIKDPFETHRAAHTLNITKGCVVTSGIYQRAFVADGKFYHHIIDPDTLYPGELWASVTVVCEDSGVADFLSTALFLVDKETGETLLNKYDAVALWVDNDGNKYYSPGFNELIRN